MQGLILLDWDLTVVDLRNEINDARLPYKIQEMISQGWIIGLNSDTPFRRLSSWYSSLDMNGPIIAEKGAIVWWPGCEDPIFTAPEIVSVLADIRDRIMLGLTHRDEFEDYALYFGDSTEFVNSGSRVRGSDSVVVAVDAFRLCSVGLFVRRISLDGNLDLSNTQDRDAKPVDDLLVATCRPCSAGVGRRTDSLVFSIDNELYFRSVHVNKTAKSSGVSLVFSEWQLPSKAYMIGNSMSDHLNISGVDQLAVGNASRDYKALASKTASEEFARGCIELLSFIQSEGQG